MPNLSVASDNDDVHIQAEVAALKERVRSLTEEFDKEVERREEGMGGIYSRLQTIERLIYIGLGGVIVIGGLVSIIGGKILKLLA